MQAEGGEKVISGSGGAGGCGSLEVVTKDEDGSGVKSSASVAMANKNTRLKVKAWCSGDVSKMTTSVFAPTPAPGPANR